MDYHDSNLKDKPVKEISIMIIDDHPVIRHGAKSILDRQENMSVVAVCSDANSALKTIKKLHPDVIVLDITMAGISGIDLIPHIKNIAKDSAIVIYTMHESIGYIHRAINAGAKGYVLKIDALSELIQAIQDTHKGRMYFSRNLPANILDQLITGTAEQGVLGNLTPREFETANLLAQGMSPEEIGKTLFISPKTVRVHRTNIMHKLGCKSVTELLLQLNDFFS